MLRAPIKKLRLFQMSYFLLIVTCFTFLTVIILLNLNFANLSNTGSYFESETERDIFLASAETFPFLNNPLIIGFPLIAGIIIFIYHIPSFTSIGLSKNNTTKNFKISSFGIPLRGYTIKTQDITIRITKKFSSLKGLLMQEFLLTIYLPKNYAETNRLYDFLACEKVNYTSTQVLLKKTINIRDTPLHLIRTRALLSVLHSDT